MLCNFDKICNVRISNQNSTRFITCRDQLSLFLPLSLSIYLSYHHPFSSCSFYLHCIYFFFFSSSFFHSDPFHSIDLSQFIQVNCKKMAEHFSYFFELISQTKIIRTNLCSLYQVKGNNLLLSLPFSNKAE